MNEEVSAESEKTPTSEEIQQSVQELGQHSNRNAPTLKVSFGDLLKKAGIVK